MSDSTPGAARRRRSPPPCNRKRTERRRSRCGRSPSTSGASTRSRTSRLAVYAGEVTCVLGDNGAGKSTLIKILSGVHPPDKGEVLFDGEPVTFAGPARCAGARDRHRVPGPRDRAADVGVAQLLPRQRADPRPGPAPAAGHQRGPADHARGDGQDGHRRPRPGPDRRNAVGRGAPGDGDRPRRLLRGQGPDPRRADLRARRPPVGDRAQVRDPGPARWDGR